MSEKIRLVLHPQSGSMQNALGFYSNSSYYDVSGFDTDDTSQNGPKQAKELSELAELREKILRESSTPAGAARNKAKKTFKRSKGGTS